MKGIVYNEGKAEVVDTLEIRPPRPGEVQVQIVRAGLCHSDVSVIDGTIPFPTPVVLGHEGVGIVSEIGEGVTGLGVGDHVVISTLSNCGQCDACDSGKPTHCRQSIGNFRLSYTYKDQKTAAFAAASCFADLTVIDAVQAVKISKDVPHGVQERPWSEAFQERADAFIDQLIDENKALFEELARL